MAFTCDSNYRKRKHEIQNIREETEYDKQYAVEEKEE